MRPLITAHTWGRLYVIHFARPLGNLTNRRAQASHYVGWALDVNTRFAQHCAGEGSHLTRAAVARGIDLMLAVSWPAPLGSEHTLKRRWKNTPRLCPVCCALHGWKVRTPVFAEQLTLPLEDGCELPDVPERPMDWMEIQTLQRWRQASIRPAADLAALDDLL